MPSVIDTTRRADLRAEAQRMRCAASAAISRLTDESLKASLRRTILRQLDDVEVFVLCPPARWQWTSAREAQWLDLGDALIGDVRAAVAQLTHHPDGKLD